jgi:hypothetical protein
LFQPEIHIAGFPRTFQSEQRPIMSTKLIRYRLTIPTRSSHTPQNFIH